MFVFFKNPTHFASTEQATVINCSPFYPQFQESLHRHLLRCILNMVILMMAYKCPLEFPW